MPQFVTAEDMIARFDERDLQQLVLDDGEQSDLVDVRDSIKLDTALDDAEGEVIAALRKAGRYDSAELAQLSGTDLSYFKRVICEIAMVHVLRRRPTFRPELLEAYTKIRESHIKEIQNGSSILSSNEPVDTAAGRVSVDGPSVSEWRQQGLWRDRMNYFPKRIQASDRMH